MDDASKPGKARDEKGRPIHAINDQGQPICGGKKTDGTPCQSQARKPNGRCKKHAGDTPSGVASPHFKHGRFSKVIPARMFETFQATLEDPAYLELKNEVALTDAILEDLVKRLDTGESAAAWTELQQVWKMFQKAQPSKDTTTAGRCLRRMGELIEGGMDEATARKEIRLTVTQRRQLAESERRRAVEAQEILTLEQAAAFQAAVLAVIKDVVKDAKLLRQIGERLDTVSRGYASGPLEVPSRN